MTDNKTALRFDALIQRKVSPFRREIEREKNRYIDEQVNELSRTGRFSDLLLDKHYANMMNIYGNRVRGIMRQSVDFSASTLPFKGLVTLERKFSLFDDIVLGYLGQFAAKKIKNITKTTENDIRRSLEEAEQQFEISEQQYAYARIKAKAFSKFRADAIARTELHQAAMYASQKNTEALAREVGATVAKKWTPTVDERTRPAHMAMLGKDAIAMDGKFDVGGEMLERPGDPNGSAANVINCRCVLTYETDF